MKKSTAIRSLLLSGLSMLLCFSMLIGSTFAWFTDEVESGTNTIMAGNLDVELYHSDKKETDAKVDGNTTLFDDVDSEKWEPGAMAWEKFTVVNEGNLALKYQLTLNALNATVIDNVSFASMLKVAVVDGTFTYTRENVAAIDADKWSDLATFTLEGKLEKQGDKAIHGIIIWWQPSDNDNLFNMNNANSGKKVSVDVGVNLFATQLDAENDSFGPDYDEDAVFADHYVTDATELQDAINNANPGDVVALMNDVNLGGTSTFALRAAEQYGLVVAEGTKVVIDLNGYSITYGSTVGAKTAVIANNGNLTIKDSVGTGKIVLTEAVVDPAYGYATDVIYNNGELVVEGGTLSLDLSGASYAIDNNSGATATINGGYVENTAGTAIRVYSWSATDASTLVVNGGEIVGTYGIRLHNLSTSVASKMNVTINGGAITGTDPTYGMALYSLCNDGINTNIAINGGTYYGDIALGGGNKVNPENFTINADNCTIYGEVYSYNTTVGDILGNEQTVVAITNVDELKALLTNGGEGILACDLELDANETITVPANITVTLDLNGKTIAGVSSKTGNVDMFLVKGILSVENGTLTLEATNNQGWNAMTTIFDVTAGGVLNVKDATVENLGGTDMNFGVHMNNWGEVTLNVENSTIKGTYCAVRVFNSGYDMNNVTIKNSDLISDGTRAFWVHNYIGDLDSSKHSDEAINARLNFDIFGNGNTYVAANMPKTPIRYGFGTTIFFDANGNLVVTASDAASLQAALDAAEKNTTVVLTADITGDVTAALKPDVKITIDGDGKTFAGVLTVDGKSATYLTAGLTVKDVTFKADSISADACINLGKSGDNNTRYTCNVTVDGCTFDVPGAVGVKSYTGGDKNLTITGCTATAAAHSLVQAKGIDGVLVENCKVYSKNGLNFNNSDNVTIIGCEVDVKGYAVRFGESSGGVGAAETYKIENCTLKSANDEGDATIILRGTADYSTLTIVNTTIVGTPDIKNTATGATVVK